jgi:hypothetical protein
LGPKVDITIIVLRIKRISLAVDYLAILSNGHVDAGPAFGIDQFDGLRHCVGIFAAVVQRLEAKARPV